MNEKQLRADIERVRDHFEQWRAQRHRGERIPIRLWEEAAEAASRHGVHAVSRAARLEYKALKRRAGKTAGRGGSACDFIEIDGVAGSEGAGCIIELEKGNGTRMRICVRDAAAVDWSRMKEAFLGA